MTGIMLFIAQYLKMEQGIGMKNSKSVGRQEAMSSGCTKISKGMTCAVTEKSPQESKLYMIP